MAASQTDHGKEEYNEDADAKSPTTSDHPSEDENSDDSQAGVRRIEAISQTWSRPALIVAYTRQDDFP